MDSHLEMDYEDRTHDDFDVDNDEGCGKWGCRECYPDDDEDCDTCLGGEYQDIHDACRLGGIPCEACEVVVDLVEDMREFADICRAEAAMR
jgi:hypothetical protein